MKIDYMDFVNTISKVSADIGSEFNKQVIKDGGQVFFGIVSPDGIQTKVSFNNKKYDEDEENESINPVRNTEQDK